MIRFKCLLTTACWLAGVGTTYGRSPREATEDSAAPARGTIPALSAATSQPVHPILIRNEHGPLARVVVEADGERAGRIRSLVFQLDGTDDLGDLESLTLFSTGDKLDFSSATPFGESVRADREIAFYGDWPLSVGKNVFWLSGRLKPTADLAHRISATCTAVETSAVRLTPRNESPAVRHRIGVALRRHQEDGVHTYRIPALATSTRGTLLAVYDMRRRMGRDLQEDIDIGLSRSSDGGRTWEPPHVIMDRGEYGGLPQEQNGCSDPGILVDRQTGEIFCFAVWMNGKPGKHQWNDDGSEPGFEIGKSAQMLVVRSQDDGQTWSQPENLTRQLKQEAWWLLAPAPQQGINLPDGTLVMPIQGREGRDALATFASIMISRDHGSTWEIGQPAFRGGNECQAAQLGDGSIMLNIRNDHERFRAVFVTRDLGRSWEPHVTNRNTLIEPNCNGSLLRVDYPAREKKHALLFANPHSQTGRTHQTIQVSFDDGQTWPESQRLLLDEGRGAGYPSLTRVDDQHVGIVYEGSQSHLVFEKFTLDELLQAPDPSQLPALNWEQTVVIAATDQTRIDAQASVPLAIPHEELRGLRLVETTGGQVQPVPSQIEPGTPPRLWWVVRGELPAATQRSYRLDRDNPVAGPAVSRREVSVERRPDAVIVSVGTSQVLQYNSAHVEAPQGVDAKYGRSAFMHPLWTPSGAVVTDQFPPDHLHQSGVFLAHTKTEFEGRTPNFWDLLGGTGRVRCLDVTSTASGPVFGELVARHEHVDLSVPGGKVALVETWQVRVWNIGGPDAGYWICDLTSTLECATGSPLRLLPYHYGGLALRGARAWDGEHARFVTSEGKDRVEGNHTRPWWCDLSGRVGDQTAGLAFFTHPANFRAPEPLRIHPTMPYMVYTPSHLGAWELTPGKPHVSQYRFVIHDGELPAATAHRLSLNFTTPLAPMIRP